MKLRYAALASVLLAHPLLAQESKLPAESLSTHFAEVSSHLELGGVFYGYADIDSDVKTLTDTLDSILDGVRKQGQAPIPEKLTATGIIAELGLDSVKAMGASSRKNGTLFHNRAFLSTPNGAKGVLKMLGGKAAPFLSTTLAPEDAAIVLEEDLNLSVVLDIVTNIMKQAEQPDALKSMEEALGKRMEPMPFTVGEFIQKLDTKITFFASIDGEKKLEIPDSPVPIPQVQAVLALNKMGWLFAELKKMVAESEEFQVQKGDGFEAIRPTKPLPPAFAGYKPVLYHDIKSDRILLATTTDYLMAALAGEKPLSGNSDFKKATTGLPTEGNGLSYVSKNAIKVIWELLDAAAKQAPNGQGDMILKIYGAMLPKGDEAMASARANLPKGMLFVSNSSDTHKSTVATAIVYPMALMAAGVGARFQNGMPMQQPGPDFNGPNNAPNNAPRVIPKAKPEEKIKNNLEQIAFASEAYFLDHPKEKTVTYAGLIKGGFLFEVTSVSGEDYKALTLKRSGGKISVQTKSGTSINHSYQAVSD
jgi:hypothetical protein